MRFDGVLILPAIAVGIVVYVLAAAAALAVASSGTAQSGKMSRIGMRAVWVTLGQIGLAALVFAFLAFGGARLSQADWVDWLVVPYVLALGGLSWDLFWVQ